MEFRILGPLEVNCQGRSVSLRGSRERALLVLLLLSANRVVSSDRLAEDLWEGCPPAGASEALRACVSRLRRSLREGCGDGVVVTQPPGYLVRIDPQALDAARFECLLARGRAEVEAGRHQAAAETLRQALALWRGSALADVAEAPFARAEAARLDEARLVALEERIEADLACGRHRELLPELDALTRTHPLRERLWGLRMVAFYRGGRQADALRAYQELRTTLAEELGLEPSGPLRALEGAILRQDPELGGQAPPPVGKPMVDWRPGAPPYPQAPDEPPSVVPLPAFLTEMGRVFVGREVELERLEDAWKEAVAGGRRAVLVSGEPGVGKTRLAAQLAAQVYEAGASVLAGRCDEDLGVPYQPFVEALRHFVDHIPDLHLAGKLGRYPGELVRLLPELAERLPDLPPPLSSDPETERYRLFEAVTGWLADAFADAPLFLVLDDLQWAAKPTLLLFRHIIRSPRAHHLLVLGIYRDTESGHDHPLVEVLADLRRHEGVERLSLRGLDSLGVVVFMEQAAGHPLDDEDLALARAIYEETEGNPFFVREVLRHLTETGAIERRDGRWKARLPVEEVGIPEGVREVVARRLTQLSKETNRVLRVAAVVGAEFEVAVVQMAEELEDEDLFTALEEACDARLVGEAPRSGHYRFVHALVRDTLYEGISAVRRVSLHRRVAEAIEATHGNALDDHLPALTHHWSRASTPAAKTVPRAVAYATRSGDRALAQLAHDEAVAFYHQAIELMQLADPAPTQRLDLLLALGEAQRRAGDGAYRQTLLDAADLAARMGDPERLARAALANNRGAWTYTMGVDNEKVTMLESALATYPPGDSATRAQLLANLGQELIFAGQGDRPHALTKSALDMARRLGDRATLAHALLARGNATFSDPPWLAEFLANSAELLALAGELDEPYLRAYAEHHRFSAAFHAGLGQEADRALEATEQAAEEAGQPILRWWAAIDRAGRVLAAGRFAEAEPLIAEVLELGLSLAQPDARQFHATLRFELLYETGRLAKDLDRLAQAVQNSERPVLRAMLALALSETGRHDEAHAVLTPLVPLLPELSMPLGTWFRTVVPAALACARLADVALVPPLYDLLLPFAGTVTGVYIGWSGSADHHLGMLATVLGRYDHAEDHFSEAMAMHTRMGAPGWLARTDLEFARMLMTRKATQDTERARGLLDEALNSARRLGQAKVESDAAALLEDL